MKCHDISARLVDFLYDEIAPAERAAFNAHLQECPTCAAEVKASSRALQRTRTALHGPLNEEPPARVHANILAAARAAAQPARKPALAEKEGFFARLWKAPWLLPAMGAAGVATAVFLIKVIKDPEVLPVREAQSPAMVAKPQSTQDKAPAPVVAPAEPPAEAKPVANQDEQRAAAPGKRERAVARPAPTRPASQGVMRRKKMDQDPLAGIELPPRSATPAAADRYDPQTENAAPRTRHAASAPKTSNAPSPWAEPPPSRGPSATKDRKTALDDLALKEGASGAGASKPQGEMLQAQPQKAMEAPRPAPAPPAAPSYAPAPSAAPAQQAPEPVEYRARAKRSAEAESMADEILDSAPLRSADKEADRAEKKGAAKESFDERVRKADKLYDEKKWYEALVAYRALLDEAPNHPSAPTWRQRFLLAEKAHKAAPTVRAKSQIQEDVTSGR